jgi:hypothetical protein
VRRKRGREPSLRKPRGPWASTSPNRCVRHASECGNTKRLDELFSLAHICRQDARFRNRHEEAAHEMLYGMLDVSVASRQVRRVSYSGIEGTLVTACLMSLFIGRYLLADAVEKSVLRAKDTVSALAGSSTIHTTAKIVTLRVLNEHSLGRPDETCRHLAIFRHPIYLPRV